MLKAEAPVSFAGMFSPCLVEAEALGECCRGGQCLTYLEACIYQQPSCAVHLKATSDVSALALVICISINVAYCLAQVI